MIFLDNNTLLITQKNKGDVISIINGSVKSQPVINVEVDNESSRGLLGISAMEKPSSGNTKFVFLYFRVKRAGSDKEQSIQIWMESRKSNISERYYGSRPSCRARTRS
jgi:Glucose / Sorbosone dehydrogenase